MRAKDRIETGILSGRDPLPSFFAPESLLPGQYFDPVGAGARDSPERRLMRAVLVDGINQLHSRDARVAAQAEQWVREPDDDDSPFAFRNICDALGIDASYLARGLLGGPDSRRPAPFRQARRVHTRVSLRRVRRRRTKLGPVSVVPRDRKARPHRSATALPSPAAS